MLRQILSVSLAMTACVAFVSTKANAATLTVATGDSLEKKPGQSITFTISFLPSNEEPLWFSELIYTSDESELAFYANSYIAPLDTPINGSTVLADLKFSVLPPNPKPDGQSDILEVSAVYYRKFLDTKVYNIVTVSPTSFDVVPVPEPLTIFGTAIGLGCGVLFKRKFSKKIVS